MNRIDSFLRLVHQLKADRLVLCAGEKAALVTGNTARPLSPDPLTEAQVLDLARPFLPAGRPAPGGADPPVPLEYDSEAGSFRGILTAAGGRLRIEMQPAPASTQPAPAPAAPDAALPQAPASAPPAADSHAAKSMQALLGRLVAEKCSDLHLTTGNPPLFRKDGRIERMGQDAGPNPDLLREMLFSVASPRDIARFEETHDADFAYELPGKARFRCNIFLDRRGMGGVFRVIPATIPSVEDLGLSRQVLELCMLNKGLVLVTGPTGSGKSTTLAALIDHVNRNRSAHIITIEDPIEFVHENKSCLVNQREVGRHTTGFKAALRAALREDPDIVLVGEMRDLETVAIAIETAETGHLVFGTLHTNSAASTVDRIVDQFPTDRHEQVRVMLSDSLRAVITQSLCRRKQGGRVAAYEVLLVSPAVSNLIREGKTFQIPSVMQTGKAQGMTTMSESLLDLVKRGIVDPAEALHHAPARQEFKALLEKNGAKMEAAAG